MSALPSGTVTLLFTDIEGSTRLLDDLGPEGYRDALAEHRRVLRELFDRHNGYEVDYEGDAFFVAFEGAGDAVAVAREGQEALAGGPVRVRMGLHTGEPLLDPPKYVGRDVHLAARVMAAGHGGQVLLTRATHALVDAEVRDLGEHRLKDFDEPVSLFQLGGQAFPPLKTVSNTNLPRPTSSFVGREREVAEVVALLGGGARLVTLTGTGGSGKTRLGIEAAAELVGEFTAGAFWVGLSALRDPGLVIGTIAQSLGAQGDLAAHINERRLLLLVDNVEQVVEAGPELAALVEACPNLSLLVTSRELLGVRGEVEYEVGPLGASDAVDLLCARGRLSPSAAAEELCRRLDYMPLALELAAARTKVMLPEQILERLGARLDLFKGGRDLHPRQQTLRATIEWSYDLLAPQEQQLFARLSVFAGGWALEAAEEIVEADPDTLQSLVEKSLVGHAGDRFWMLETIREYAAETFAALAGDERISRRHADYYGALAQRAEPELRGRSQDAWTERLARDQANLTAAIRFYIECGPVDSALRTAGALRLHWARRGPITEGRMLLESALGTGSEAPPEVRAKALWASGHLAYMQDDRDRERTFFEEALRLYRQSDDAAGELRTELELGWMELALGQGAALRQIAERYVERARELSDSWLVAYALQLAGAVAAEAGEFEAARLAQNESIALFQSFGDHRASLSAWSTLGWFAILEEDYEGAISPLTEAIALTAPDDSELVTINRCNLGVAHLLMGNDEQAAEEFLATVQLAADVGAQRVGAESLIGLAAIAARAGQREAAARLRGAAKAIHEACSAPLNPAEERIEQRFLSGLDTSALTAGEEAGRAMTLEDAAREALELAATIRPNAA